ncbi:hypothetical protein M5585_22880 [Serratia ureilytica]
MHDTYTLFGTQGCGSTIVAAALVLTAFPGAMRRWTTRRTARSAIACWR